MLQNSAFGSGGIGPILTINYTGYLSDGSTAYTSNLAPGDVLMGVRSSSAQGDDSIINATIPGTGTDDGNSFYLVVEVPDSVNDIVDSTTSRRRGGKVYVVEFAANADVNVDASTAAGARLRIQNNLPRLTTETLDAAADAGLIISTCLVARGGTNGVTKCRFNPFAI